MHSILKGRLPAVALVILGLGGMACAEEPDFARDVRPILAAHCFKCHGPDAEQRQAELRLDLRDSATAPAESGHAAIVPGKPEASELVRRIYSDDPGEIMPPPETKHPLTAEQKRMLTEWIRGGAEYRPHWAFEPIRRPALPVTRDPAWERNAIDAFVFARLNDAGLKPSPEADRYALVRRLYLDLIGIPPTPEEADRFVSDEAPDAYDRLVDRLLASPHYGERWARRWLDLARYADTNGYEKDRPRTMWPYRDWVIDALNADLPFDQFTIRQLAGDMLPGASVAERVATGFHRNTMINEEGGIDPLEFRFYAMVDRVNTTGTTWLGLTLGCCQCHSHKFDPVSQREYYQVMALLNNADEPTMEVPVPDLVARRRAIEAQARQLEAELPGQFPPKETMQWMESRLVAATSEAGAVAECLEDGSVRWSGTNPETDTYHIVVEAPTGRFTAVRLEAMADPQLPSHGPGRTPHGNFVLTELTGRVTPHDGSEERELTFASARTDFAQEGFPVEKAIDGDAKTGWAIHGPDKWNVTRTAIFILKEPIVLEGPSKWTFRVDQQFGKQHTLGRVRITLGSETPDDRPLDIRRREHLETRFAEWLADESKRAVPWIPLRPVSAEANLPKLTILEDGSVLASGDQSKRDVYHLHFDDAALRGATALRLEAIADDRLPRRGPGRVYYEGPFGDFFLSEVTARCGEKPHRFAAASHSFANGANTAAAAIDGDPQTGWTINGGQGKTHAAVFQFAEPLKGESFDLELLFERYYAAGLGRFRISVTRQKGHVEARGLPADIEELLVRGESTWNPDERQKVLRHFLSVCPELASARAKIDALLQSRPELPTTLVFQERPPDHPRPTFVHRRGEFLQPTEAVVPDVPQFLPPFSSDGPHNRLDFARWLVDGRNPLVARVTVNRHWAAFFGRGIVRTTEDFGYQGDLPTHPELLDWLAAEFMQKGWSVKRLHRLIVTSATYRQSSAISPEGLERDPENLLLGRGPSVRLEGELIRDSLLQASGLLARRVGGPSVFPPQPPGVTSEGTYGALAWKVSEGADRYRRGLYTFMKRTAPYAMFATFDGPSGESCVPRRDVTNTPLQALTMLNDEVSMEAAQALGRMTVAHGGTAPAERATFVFRRWLIRPPTSYEREQIIRFYEKQRKRLAAGELDAASIAGVPPNEGKPEERVELAAWTLVARAVSNLHEAIVKP